MTAKEFAIKLLKEQFVDKSIDHRKSNWGHNFHSHPIYGSSEAYTALQLIILYWDKADDSIGLLIRWLEEDKLVNPFNSSSILAWNLYFSFKGGHWK
jgi:hypothetical protein